MTRKRKPTDDLYSALYVTTKPILALYAGMSEVSSTHRKVLIENQMWELEEREMRFYLNKEAGGANVYQNS